MKEWFSILHSLLSISALAAEFWVPMNLYWFFLFNLINNCVEQHMLDVRVTSILNLNNVIIKLKHRHQRTSASTFYPVKH